MKQPIRPLGFYVFRKPLLPVDRLIKFLDDTADAGPTAQALRPLYAQPDLQEAIYHASPHLYQRLRRWLREPNLPKKEALHATLLKYLIRASTRSTPYGTFAGCLSPGQFGSRTEVTFDEQHATHRYTRLRTDCLVSLQQQLAQAPDVFRRITFYPNDSLYRWGAQYRYTTYHTDAGTRQYALCAVDATPGLDAVLETAADGATFSEMVGALAEQDIPVSASEPFVRALIDEQVLAHDLQVRATGTEAGDRLRQQLADWEDTLPAVNQRLGEVQQLLASPELAPQHHRLVAMVAPDRDASRSVTHTDLRFRTRRNTIGRSVVGCLAKTLNELTVLDQGNYNRTLATFKQQFYQRYEEQEVPLLEALDSELGVGYGPADRRSTGNGPMPEAIDLSHDEDTSLVEWNYWKDFVLRQYSEALRGHASEIRLQPEDLDALRAHHRAASPTPATFTAWGSLLATSAQEMDQGHFQFHLRQLAGPSGVSLLGRFCYGDPALQEQVAHMVRVEEEAHPEVIFAEIAHLPDEREGTVASRPTLRRYEIPVLTRPSVDPEYQIPLSDLLVSVKNGQHLVLRSRRHNRRVIPRLSVAHNFHRGHPLYRFLGAVQFDEQALNVRWHWGVLEKQRFLPRVSYRNVILSRATWTLVTGDYPVLCAPATSDRQFSQALHRHFPHLPRYVQWVENDHELLIDRENPGTLGLLRQAFCKKEIVMLKEYLMPPSYCLLHDRAGCYTHELIIPFGGNPLPYRFTQSGSAAPTVRREFAPGSEWLYLKLYTGAATADKLLGTAVPELTERLLLQGLIDHWFFIRYADPETHLRLRFHRASGATDRFYTELLPTVYRWADELQGAGYVQQVQTDTYRRELERYGSDTMAASERLFFHDSRAVVRFLSSSERSNEETRWQLAFGGVNQLLNDFRYTLPDKVRLLSTLRQAYLAEFGVTRVLRRQLDTNYRAHAVGTLGGLASGYALANPELHRILGERSRAGSEAVAEIMDRSGDWDRLLASYVHMFLNRLFAVNPRQHELLVYYYLEKYYRSEQCRSEKEIITVFE